MLDVAPHTEEPMEELARLVGQRRVILFAGAGLSMSVGLPSWGELIRHMCSELKLEDEGQSHPARYQALAEYYRIRRGSLAPLAQWMRRNWQVSRDAVAASAIHRLVLDLDFPIIYTTNYDANLEAAFELHGRKYLKITSASDLPQSAAGVTQIIKFHGDLEDDDSLVLAESDYFGRLHFESPLDIKFRADTLMRSVLFIGYSMSDMNIRLLLFRLWEIWKAAGLADRRPNSFLVTSRADRVQEALLAERGIRVITPESNDPQEALLSFLTDLAGHVGKAA
jgi:hypothetical protein